MKQRVVIIGGGASALFLACELNPKKFQVSIYEKNAALGRKFLVAGDGGLNFTHSEVETEFIKRYTPAHFLEKAFQQYSNTSFIKWMNDLGIPTYVGSSKRLFPQKNIKPIEVLEKIKSKILSNGVQLKFKHQWIGFSDSGKLVMRTNSTLLELEADICVFCLGGASWSVTGSSGDWQKAFQSKQIQTTAFQSSNCAFQINWNHVETKIEGQVLKNCAFTCNGKTHLGEAVITRFGIEGSGVYPLSPQIREELYLKGKAKIFVDFKPNQSEKVLLEKLRYNSERKTVSQRLKENLKLSALQLLLIKSHLSKEEFSRPQKLISAIKKFELVISGLAPLEESISTVGGISLEELNENFELKKMKNHFVIGEMIDYDAPTGGYLLQSCFSMGAYLANVLNSGK